jgi:hypothetical protein
VDLALGFEYRPVANVGLSVGYRTMVMGMSAGDDAERFEFLGSHAGLSAGISVRF